MYTTVIRIFGNGWVDCGAPHGKAVEHYWPSICACANAESDLLLWMSIPARCSLGKSFWQRLETLTNGHHRIQYHTMNPYLTTSGDLVTWVTLGILGFVQVGGSSGLKMCVLVMACGTARPPIVMILRGLGSPPTPCQVGLQGW
jgi:hypothetical protein